MNILVVVRVDTWVFQVLFTKINHFQQGIPPDTERQGGTFELELLGDIYKLPRAVFT